MEIKPELGTKENPHPFKWGEKNRIKDHHYYGRDGIIKKWNGKYLCNNDYYSNYQKQLYNSDKNYVNKKLLKARERWENKTEDEKKNYRERERRWRQTKKGKEATKRYNKKYRANRTFEKVVHDIVRDKKNDRRVKCGRIKFDLTEEYILKLWKKQNGRCALSGEKMNWEACSMNILSIDRIDSINGKKVLSKGDKLNVIIHLSKRN